MTETTTTIKTKETATDEAIKTRLIGCLGHSGLASAIYRDLIKSATQIAKDSAKPFPDEIPLKLAQQAISLAETFTAAAFSRTKELSNEPI